MVRSSLYFHGSMRFAKFYCALGDLRQLSLFGSVLLWRFVGSLFLEGPDIGPFCTSLAGECQEPICII